MCRGLNGTFNGVAVTPFYRLYHRHSGEHHWTTDAYEYSVLPSISNNVWVQEGIDGYVIPANAAIEKIADLARMYRLYHSGSGRHIWTTDEYEREVLLGSGWISEGLVAHVMRNN